MWFSNPNSYLSNHLGADLSFNMVSATTCMEDLTYVYHKFLRQLQVNICIHRAYLGGEKQKMYCSFFRDDREDPRLRRKEVPVAEYVFFTLQHIFWLYPRTPSRHEFFPTTPHGFSGSHHFLLHLMRCSWRHFALVGEAPVESNALKHMHDNLRGWEKIFAIPKTNMAGWKSPFSIGDISSFMGVFP